MTFILFITFQALFLAYVPLTHVPRIFKFQEKHALGKYFCEFTEKDCGLVSFQKQQKMHL